jgi:hypothetical protein
MNTYWTDIEHEALRNIRSFDEMVPVGIGILERMAQENSHIVQICGPMTTGGRGSLAANMEHFNRAMVLASKNGLCVFDQTPFQDAMVRLGADWDARREYCLDILHIFYRGIFMSGHLRELMFLPDWRSSTGATWEYEEGKKLGLVVSDYPEEWLRMLM